MRAMLVGCAIIAGCGGGGGGGTPPTGDGGGSDGPNQNATKITFTLTSAPSDVEAFGFVAAYQDGDGAWKPAPARSGDTYAFDVSSATWGFAYTCQVNVRIAGVVTDLRDVVEYHFAVAERTSLTDDILTRCTDRIATVELSGTISPLPSAGTTYRVAYNDTAVFIDRTTGKYDMLVAPGTHDLLVLHGSEHNTPGDFLIDAAVVQRNLAVTAAMTRDVAANNATATKSLSVSVSVPGQTPMSSETTTNLFTANGTAVSMAHVTKPPQTQLASTALANSQLAAGDVYDQRVTVEFVKGQAVTTTMATTATTTTPANVSITTAPTPLGATPMTTSAATMPYPRFRSTWPTYAGAVGYTRTLAQTPPAAGCGGSPACTITWTAWVAPGAVGAMPSYTMPDLSQLPGWSTALGFVAGTMATGDVTAMTSSVGAMDFPPQPPVAGTKRVFAHSTFTVTPTATP
ncbi:MAG TPA: hypothetical protein VF516_17525 [Kofleriaceae bacterium]